MKAFQEQKCKRHLVHCEGSLEVRDGLTLSRTKHFDSLPHNFSTPHLLKGLVQQHEVVSE